MVEAYKIPIVLESDPEGGYAIRSPMFPELISEADTLEEAIEHAKDAVLAVIELYEDLGKQLPVESVQDPQRAPISYEILVASA